MEHAPAPSLNYDYVLRLALSSTSIGRPRILDFGSGQGRLVALALARNVDIYGVDLPGVATSERMRPIVDGHIPFADQAFDVVVSNQVFEHIADPKPSLVEIHRVLKRGGTLIALFPDGTVWFEGHLGLYFVHWLTPYPRLQHFYLVLCHKLGFGYGRGTDDAADWARRVTRSMKDEVFFHSPRDQQMWWSEVFGAKPEALEQDWMVFCLAASRRLRRLVPLARQPWMARPLRTICRMRAGVVLRLRKT
jgi:SAM-dependent methyltransferase